MRIILIGYMGSGKTTIGKKIANQLGVPFIDSDHEIEKLAQNSISELFTIHGESHFRQLETHFISKLDRKSSFVLSTGGGMPCFGKNMKLLNNLGTTIYLHRPAKELANRLKNAKKERPLLADLNEDELIDYIERQLSIREQHYHQAHIIAHREEQSVDDIIRKIDLKQKNVDLNLPHSLS